MQQKMVHQSVTITITENESAPTVTLTSSASSIAENAGSSLTLTATLSVATTRCDSWYDLLVELEQKELTIATISDITISAGATTGTASFTPTDDSVYEGNETGIVAIASVSGGSATEDGTQSVTITITENESSPTVALTTSASSIAENSGSTLTLTATISQAADEDVTVILVLQEHQQMEPIMDQFIMILLVSAGATTGTATFDPTDDSVYEGSETAVISITSVSGADAVEDGSQSVTITITDNESAPTVTLAVSATSIAENAGSSLTLTATLSGTTDSDITVALDTSGTATEGTDYTDGSGNIDDIVISAGEQQEL